MNGNQFYDTFLLAGITFVFRLLLFFISLLFVG